MAAFNVYKNAASQFVAKYKIGTKISSDDIVKFATDTDDVWLAPHLEIEDEDRKVAALARCLNRGGKDASPAFFLKVEDRKRGSRVVQSLYDRTMEVAAPINHFRKATSASVSARRAAEALEDIPTEDLTEEQKASMTTRRKFAGDFAAGQKEFATEFGNSVRLEAYKRLGADEAMARKLLASSADNDALASIQRRLDR